MRNGLSSPLAEQQGVRYFSLARHALQEALRLAGVGASKRVLFPAYVCRDLLAPVALLGAEAVWYDLDPGLAPLLPPENWPTADAVLAVNYFGFPQDLSPFAAYAARTGAVVIEDNAHGFLSRAPDGRWLGCRAGLGLFSLRKTLRIQDGGALWAGSAAYRESLVAQLPFDGSGLNPAQLVKARLRAVPLVGESLFRAATGLARWMRKVRSGSATPPSDPASERELPPFADPWAGLPDALRAVDAAAEIRRRRAAYAACAAAGERAGVAPVFASLPEGCAPYGYAFRPASGDMQAMRAWAAARGFDLVSWPDLPTAVVEGAPEYYCNVMLVNFL